MVRHTFVSNMGTQVDIEGSAVINVFGLKTSVERFKLISNTGFSDFDYTYENDVISVPGGPFLSVSAERMSVSILEQTVRGNFNFEKTNNGYVKASVSDGSLSLGSESSPLLEFNQLNGSFSLSDHVSAMGGGVLDFNVPQLLLVVRIRLSSITLRKKKDFVIGGESYHFPKGPYFKINGQDSRLSIANQIITGDFSFENDSENVVSVAVSEASLLIGTADRSYVTVNGARGSF